MKPIPIDIPTLAQWLASATPAVGRVEAETRTQGPMFTSAPVKTRVMASTARRARERARIHQGRSHPIRPMGTPLSVTNKMGQKKLRHTGASVMVTAPISKLVRSQVASIQIKVAPMPATSSTMAI